MEGSGAGAITTATDFLDSGEALGCAVAAKAMGAASAAQIIIKKRFTRGSPSVDVIDSMGGRLSGPATTGIRGSD